MSLDFSQKPELKSLGRVINALQVVAAPAGVEFFLTGAAARDLMLRYAHNIEPTRQTEDVDFAVMVSDWQSFDALREALIASGEFFPCSGPATHQLRHKSNLPLDIVPFGGIERADRTIVWPPDQSTVFDCFGAREAFAASAWVQLPECSPMRVPSIPALAILKVVAWHDRKRTHPGKDAVDLLLYLRTYMDCGNLNRASTEHRDLFETDAFDYAEAGARLLGRDIARLLAKPAIPRIMEILVPEADENGALLLASQSGLDLELARRLVQSVCDELACHAAQP